MNHWGRWPIHGRYRRAITAAALLCSSATVCAAQPPETLVQAWLALPNASAVAWPYAYIRTEATQTSQEGARKDLFDEYERLSWRLEDDRYPRLAQAVDAWQDRLAAIDHFRVPGNWSPAYLLSHVNRKPPVARITALGACQAPTTITVWDAEGVRDIAWQPGMRLSDVERVAPATRQGSAPEIAVVDPYGRIDHYGVQAWNYADGPVAPGSQVVASLPLDGSAFAWIRDAMARVLAHAPSGTDCREQALTKVDPHD